MQARPRLTPPRQKPPPDRSSALTLLVGAGGLCRQRAPARALLAGGVASPAAGMGRIRALARRAGPRALAARRARDRLALQRPLCARHLLLVRDRDRGLHGDPSPGLLRAAGA